MSGSAPPASVQRLRQRNLGRILDVVSRSPEVRQSDLPALTELATGAVSSMVNELIDRGLIADRSLLDGGRGRPARLLRIVDESADLVAVAVTADGIEVRTHTLAGREIERSRGPFEPGWTPEEAGNSIVGLIAPLMDQVARADSPAQVVISIPGRAYEGSLDSIELGWIRRREADLLAPLERAGYAETIVGNDGGLAALAEATLGPEPETSHTVVVLLERGLGGSAIIEGELVSGYRKPAGWGHIPLDPEGKSCPCGLRGCAEQLFSIGAIAHDLGESPILAATRTADYVADVVRRASAGDVAVERVLQVARTRLRELSDVLAASFDPDKIVLTGRGVLLAPWLLPLTAGNTHVPVESGTFGGDAAIAGAMVGAQRARFDRAR